MLICLGKFQKRYKVIEEKQRIPNFIQKISESIDVDPNNSRSCIMVFFNKENREYSGIESQSMGINGTRISIGIYKRSRKYLDSNQNLFGSLVKQLIKLN